MRTALDVLARLPTDNDNDNKFANVSGRGGGEEGGQGTGGGMIINLQCVPAAICQGQCCDAGRNGTD